MTQTVFGVLTDKLGHASKTVAEQGARRPELRFQAWSTPSAEIRSVQNDTIPIDVDHSGVEVGRVVYLERTKSGDLWCVGEVSDDVLPVVHVRVGSETIALEHPLYWSATRIGGPEYGIVIDSIALTSAPARINPKPVRFLPGGVDYRQVAGERWHLRDFELELMTRCAESHLDRRRTSPLEPLVVRDLSPQVRAPALEVASSMHRIETRAVEALDVSPSKRQVDLLVAPAGVPATIYERGKQFTETYAHGCFSDAERAPHRVLLNRDHEIRRTFGKATEIDAWNEAGCVATFQISKVQDGDEAIELLKDGIAACSAGFQLEANGDRWQGNNRTIVRARLDHVAITAAPAHQTAVLGVRDRPLVAT